MKLITGPFSLYGVKVEVALAEKGIDAQIEFVPFSFSKGYEPKHPDVLRLNPKQQVPLLLDGDLEIFDSTLINEYLEDRYPQFPLWPSDPKKRAEARLWELKSDEVLFPQNATLRRHLLFPSEVPKEEAEAARSVAEKFMVDLDERLVGRDFVVDGFSYADTALFFSTFFSALLGVDGKDQKHFRQWRARLATRPSFQPIVARLLRMLDEAGLPKLDLT